MDDFGFWLTLCVVLVIWYHSEQNADNHRHELQREIVTACAQTPDPIACGRNVAAAAKAAK